MSKLNGNLSTSSRWEKNYNSFFDKFFAEYSESFDLDLTLTEFVKDFNSLPQLLNFFALASAAYQVANRFKSPNIEVGMKGPVLSFKTSVRKSQDFIDFDPQLAADLFNYVLSSYTEDDAGNLIFNNTIYDDKGKLLDSFQLLYVHNGIVKGLHPTWNYNSLECIPNVGLPKCATKETFSSFKLHVKKVNWNGKVIFNVAVK